MNDLKSLATFIYINTADISDSKSIAFINSILSDKNNVEAIQTVLNKLDKTDRSEFITYDEGQDIEDLLKNLFDLLRNKKIVFIDIYAKQLDPLLFNQLSCYREINSFQGTLPKHNLTISQKPFPSESSLFLIFHVAPGAKPMAAYYELSDHVIDMRNESDEDINQSYVSS